MPNLSLAAKACENEWERARAEWESACALRDDLVDRIIPMLEIRRMETYELFRKAAQKR